MFSVPPVLPHEESSVSTLSLTLSLTLLLFEHLARNFYPSVTICTMTVESWFWARRHPACYYV